MSTYDNGTPETPEWTPDTRPNPLEPRMSGLETESHLVRGEN